MSEFVQGQRWVVDSEPELGLGIVVEVNPRSVSILFPQADCERAYTTQQAPLTRIAFSVSETIHLQSSDESYTVACVHEQDGLIIYETTTGELFPETMLSGEIQLNQPLMRLMTGQLDRSKWFYFRRQLDAAMAKTWSSRLNGLLGVRANLIPHQLYVAHSACDRENVRVLLADEVGLGKTIEAGMILNRLLKQERVSRALICIPDALQVQWLIELIRRFQIKPELYAGEEHDFDVGQIHLIPHSALATEAERLTQGDFDMVAVDEAHHIRPENEEFSVLRALSERAPHVVLLTATPEQLGFESHFARLQLLDPEKYSDIDAFVEEEKGYGELNQLIKALPDSRSALVDNYKVDASLDDEALVDQLLDYHGVGRVMYRNERRSVKGFPQRVVHPHILEDDSWETRYKWLAQWLKQTKGTKTLVICHSIDHVVDCQRYLWQKHGTDAALFHEEMNLIERDRAAAYFSDMEYGSQVLICSEIGSEGRNFQFSQNLVCLDIPDHPDLLEQRIGRLDRIGQEGDVNIHMLFAEGSVEQRHFQWYHDVLNCIAQQNPAAGAVHDEYHERIHWDEPCQDLFNEAAQKVESLHVEIENGRDALLGMNSCRQPLAGDLVSQITEFEQDSPLSLVEMASELLNFHFEETHLGIYSLIPADNMMIASLPGIPAEGTELTFQREIATRREDILFVTWDSPFITGLWEILHHSDLGSACVALLPGRTLPPGQCLLEVSFDVVIQSEFASACLPFLPQKSVRTVVLDVSDKDLSAALSEESLQQSITRVDKKLARKIVRSKKDDMQDWYNRAEAFAEEHKKGLIDAALEEVTQFYHAEIARVAALAEKNPNVDPADISTLEAKYAGIKRALTENAGLQSSVIRLIVTTEPNPR